MEQNQALNNKLSEFEKQQKVKEIEIENAKRQLEKEQKEKANIQNEFEKLKVSQSPPQTPKLNDGKQGKQSSTQQSPPPTFSPPSNFPTIKRTGSEIALFLKEIDLEHLTPVFEKEDIDIEVLLCISDQDMKELGITMGHRKKILAKKPFCKWIFIAIILFVV